MRQLTETEIASISGGFGLIGAGIGGAIGFSSALYNGATSSGLIAATALGAASGLTGNFAAAATGGLIARGTWGLRSVGLGFASGVASGETREDDS